MDHSQSRPPGMHGEDPYGTHRMRIVHDAHTCSDDGERELILPKRTVLTGSIVDPSGIDLSQGMEYWPDPVSDVPPDADVVANTSKLVTNGKDMAVQVLVHTAITDEVRRKLLLKLALETVQVVEVSVAGMTENQAMEELVKMGEVKVEQE